MKMLLFLILVLAFAYSTYSVSPGEISEKMCRKYAEAVYVLEPDLGMSSQTGFNNVSECGIVSVPLIIGGEEATEKEFPHFALVGFGRKPDDQMAWYCGGSLISENFVLTAGHCTYSVEHGPAQKVKMGMIRSDPEDEDDDAVTEELIEKIIKHPEYKPPSKYNDIALLQLKNAIDFSPFIRPACLNTKYVMKEHSAIAIGFGKTSVDSNKGSKVLMKVILNLIEREDCKRYFSKKPFFRHGVVASMICAGVLEGGKDTCQGDSGGPMQVILEDPYCMYRIVGVTSFGVFCGYANSPAIYTNVSHYISWIENVVWGSQ